MIVYAKENLSALLDPKTDRLRAPTCYGTQGSLKLDGALAPTFKRGDVLVYSQHRNRVFAYVGVLRDAWRDADDILHWRYYETFYEPYVVADDDNGAHKRWAYEPCKGFGPGDAQTVSSRALQRVLAEASSPVRHASAFGRVLLDWFETTPGVLAKAWKAHSSSTFQLAFDADVRRLLVEYCARHGLPGEPRLQTEGLVAGRERDEKTYNLLGTTAWPDSAVIGPFRCAIEYDHQGRPTSASELKTTLGKTASHVLSGAYPVAVHIFFLRRDGKLTRDDFLNSDGDQERVQTATYLDQLRQLGLYVAVVGPTTRQTTR